MIKCFDKRKMKWTDQWNDWLEKNMINKLNINQPHSHINEKLQINLI